LLRLLSACLSTSFQFQAAQASKLRELERAKEIRAKERAEEAVKLEKRKADATERINK
jgi:hypothetical protein